MAENEGFENDQQALDTGLLLGHLSGRGIPAYQELNESSDYTPVVRIEIEGQLPVWVRVLTR
jgi:hypothetical protein